MHTHTQTYACTHIQKYISKHFVAITSSMKKHNWLWTDSKSTISNQIKLSRNYNQIITKIFT